MIAQLLYQLYNSAFISSCILPLLDMYTRVCAYTRCLFCGHPYKEVCNGLNIPINHVQLYQYIHAWSD